MRLICIVTCSYFSHLALLGFCTAEVLFGGLVGKTVTIVSVCGKDKYLNDRKMWLCEKDTDYSSFAEVCQL